MSEVDQKFEDKLREAYVAFGPRQVGAMARQEHAKVLERDEFLKEFIEWAAYMGFDGHGMKLRIKAKRLLGWVIDDGEELEYLEEEDDGEEVPELRSQGGGELHGED